ncbi:MAG: pyruvate kinase [Eubacteriales bacterium]|nr:pyruvate kinase [Eubacteriales bacterium]
MLEIFGTLGPACSERDILERMFLEGMTGMRLNMSHSGLKESEALIDNFHQAARKAGVKPELLIDMQGPELRIGRLSQPLVLKESEEIRLVDQKEPTGDSLEIPVPDSVFPVLEAGDQILLDDGKMELAVTEVKPKVIAKVIRAGTLESRKSLKVVNKYISGPAVTARDKENIRLAKEYGVTSLMQPFVTRGEELIEVREALQKNQVDHVRIFAKIENCQGMRNIEDIIPYADMIVIARGDLGNDMPLWKLPVAQKELAEICTERGRPFLVVTQMLASMVQNPVPTRAEVSDIFHAVADGAKAVMVTNETAVGRYPVEVIRYLKRTAEEAAEWKKCTI